MSARPVVIEVPDLSDVRAVSDSRLLELIEIYERASRRVDAGSALLAGEVARRSSREHGYQGLAQRTGDRTPDALIARVAGTSAPEARRLVQVGRVLDAPAAWLADVALGVADGGLSVGAASAIASGLGDPSATVSADDLLDAAQQLVREAGDATPETIARRARELRDDLDAAGVADREAALRDKRFLRLTPMPDGMTRVFGMLDPESAALVGDAIDCVTSPRRGGPRFVDSAELARSTELSDDPRSTEQIALDALVDMVRIAGAADTGRVFGARRPGVRIVVDESDRMRGEGAALLEGQTVSVSLDTAERVACATGYEPVVVHLDGGLDVGRAQRLFTDRQRTALAVRWGGCAVEGCSRPPASTEAHHIREWSAGGATDVDNGILLCRHHHLLVHNNHWRIRRDDDGWWMAPPGTDAVVRPVRLVSKAGSRVRALARA